MPIVSANVKMAGSRVDKVKLAATLTVVTRCKATLATGKQRPLQLRFRHQIGNLIMVQRQHSCLDSAPPVQIAQPPTTPLLLWVITGPSDLAPDEVLLAVCDAGRAVF